MVDIESGITEYSYRKTYLLTIIFNLCGASLGFICYKLYISFYSYEFIWIHALTYIFIGALTSTIIFLFTCNRYYITET